MSQDNSNSRIILKSYRYLAKLFPCQPHTEINCYLISINLNELLVWMQIWIFCRQQNESSTNFQYSKAGVGSLDEVEIFMFSHHFSFFVFLCVQGGFGIRITGFPAWNRIHKMCYVLYDFCKQYPISCLISYTYCHNRNMLKKFYRRWPH